MGIGTVASRQQANNISKKSIYRLKNRGGKYLKKIEYLPPR